MGKSREKANNNDNTLTLMLYNGFTCIIYNVRSMDRCNI